MISLRTARTRLTVDPAFGCRWMRLDVKTPRGWADVLVPASPAKLRRDPYFDGAFLLAPWCNRIPKARFRFQGQAHGLRPNFFDGSAIHGDVLARAWRVAKKTATSFEAVFDSRTAADFNFPWPIVARHGARLTSQGVEAWLSVTNAGDAPCPAGVGFHPFLRRGPDADIVVPARRHFPSRNAVPIGAARPIRGGRTTVSLKKDELDRGFTQLAGTVRVNAGALDVTLAPGRGADHLFVWAPRKFRGRTAGFLCVEPMTMSVDGFRRKDRGARDSGVKILKPGETLRMDWRIAATPRPPTAG